MLTPQPVVLDGRRVRLEPLDHRHLGDLQAAGEEDPSLFRFMSSNPYLSGGWEAWFSEAHDGEAAGRYLCWATIDTECGRVVGSTRYGDIEPKHERLEVGWTWIAPSHQRTGLNVEAKFLQLKQAFEILGVRRVAFKTDARNFRSRQAIEGIGAVFEGVLRSHIKLPDGFVRDTVFYSVLAGEWPGVRDRLLERVKGRADRPLSSCAGIARGRPSASAKSGTAASAALPAAIIFDLDGTLVDTVETRITAWLRTFDEQGILADREQVAALIGSDGRRLATVVADAAAQPIDPARAEAIDRRAGEIYGDLNKAPQPLPGARALLEALEEREMLWAIATSSRREQLDASIRALALSRGPTVIDGSDVEHAKPAPDLLLFAARELGVEPSSAWYVGDAIWDMQAARAAGMLAIGVVSGAATAEDLRAASAWLTIDNLWQLLQLIDER
jgi:HAD superfamily hydrolase (TIGR01509 family)